MSQTAQTILAAAGLVTALGVLWRALHLGELTRGTRLFLLDWFGEPARDGREAVPSFPARIAAVERRTADLAHDFRGELSSRLTLLAYTVDRVHDATTSNAERLTLLDERVSDHRRRNDEQVRLLREAIARTEAQLTEVRRRGEQRRASDPPDPTRHPEDR